MHCNRIVVNLYYVNINSKLSLAACYFQTRNQTGANSKINSNSHHYKETPIYLLITNTANILLQRFQKK